MLLSKLELLMSLHCGGVGLLLWSADGCRKVELLSHSLELSLGFSLSSGYENFGY